MGYRSDVRIIVSKKGYKELRKYVEEHIKKYKSENIKEGSIASVHDFNLLNFLDVSKSDSNKDIYYLGWNDVKWYDGYEDVDAIMDGLEKLKLNGYEYHFGRLGEDYEDIEWTYFFSEDGKDISLLECPCVERRFADDDYVDIDLTKEFKKKSERDER